VTRLLKKSLLKKTTFPFMKLSEAGGESMLAPNLRWEGRGGFRLK